MIPNKFIIKQFHINIKSTHNSGAQILFYDENKKFCKYSFFVCPLIESTYQRLCDEMIVKSFVNPKSRYVQTLNEYTTDLIKR